MGHKHSKAILLLIFLILSTELSISKLFSEYVSNPTNAKIRAKIKLARQAQLNNEIIVLGDSSGAGAINANLLKEITGINCLNLSLIGNCLIAGDYFIFEEYLKTHKPPKYIILMNVYQIWSRDMEYSGTTGILMANFETDMRKNYYCLGLMDKREINVAKNILFNLMPSRKYKGEIIRMLESKNIIEYLGKLKEESLKIEEELLKNNGSSLYTEKNSDYIINDIKTQVKFTQENKFKVSKINRFFLDKLISKANEMNIKVLLLYHPAVLEFYEKTKNNEHISAYKEFMRSLPALYPNTSLLEDDFYVANLDKFSLSIDHLDDKESLIFTAALAKKIIQFKKYQTAE